MKWWVAALSLAASGLASGLWLANARGEEAPPTQQVREESTCQPILQEFNQMKLLSLQADPESGAMKMVYGRLVNKHLLVLWLFTRAGCHEPMGLVKATAVDPNPKECPEGMSCL